MTKPNFSVTLFDRIIGFNKFNLKRQRIKFRSGITKMLRDTRYNDLVTKRNKWVGVVNLSLEFDTFPIFWQNKGIPDNLKNKHPKTCVYLSNQSNPITDGPNQLKYKILHIFKRFNIVCRAHAIFLFSFESRSWRHSIHLTSHDILMISVLQTQGKAVIYTCKSWTYTSIVWKKKRLSKFDLN